MTEGTRYRRWCYILCASIVTLAGSGPFLATDGGAALLAFLAGIFGVTASSYWVGRHHERAIGRGVPPMDAASACWRSETPEVKR